ISAGFLFKPSILAGLVIIIGDVLAALGTFLFGKYIFSDWVVTQVEKRPMFKALNAVIAEEGWKIVVMLRLTPLPFNLISYFFSVSSINLLTFLWATVIGVIPGTFNAVWIGSLVKSLSGIDKPNLEKKDIVIITMNFIIAACCVIALSILGKRSLRKAMVKLEASRDTEDDQGNPPINVPKSNIVVDEESILNSRAGKFTFIEKIVLTVIITIAFLNVAIFPMVITTEDTIKTNLQVDAPAEFLGFNKNDESAIIQTPKSTIDELSELLSNNLISTNKTTFRAKNYKASPLLTRSKKETQEERRKQALEEQKRRKCDFFTHARNLAFADLLTKPIKRRFEVEQDDDENNDKISIKKARHKVMHAEWMYELPNDLEENWYVVLCPVGNTMSRLRN
ncbi:10952_t:CDS:10, partial [Entrophospora sp. SA101]